MPNSRSAIKRTRQTATRTLHNRALKSRIRTCHRALAKLAESGDESAQQSALSRLFSAADRAAKGGAIHQNAVNRIKHRGAKLIRREPA